MAEEAPNSYKDPYWSQLASNTEQKLGLPDGLLSSIVLNGEKSNADQVSDAGAKTPFQITPATRKAAIDKYGIDPYLSPENAAEVAGNLLKDSLKRNGDDPAAAIGEYHGGTDRANWGTKTNAYVKRVMGGMDTPDAATTNAASTAGGSTFDRVQAQMQQGQPASIAKVYAAYKGGQMTPQDASDFEKEVSAGTIMLPRGASLNPTPAQPPAADGQPPSVSPTDAQTGATPVPDAMLQAYKSGQMSDQDRQDFESLVKSGELQMPQGVDLGTPDVQKPGLLQKIENIPGTIKESITGTKRTTPEVQDALDQGRTFDNIPENHTLSWGAVKSALGDMFANPKEKAQIWAANLPGVTVREDSHGNQWLRSPTDGKEYVIQPGFDWQHDIPSALGSLAAFTPAGRAETAIGMGLKSAGTQAAIEGTQAATGGNFDSGDVLAAGAMGTAAIPATNAVRAVIEPAAGMLQRLRGAPEPIINPAQQAVNAAPEAAAADAGAPAVPEPVPQAAAPAPVAAPEAVSAAPAAPMSPAGPAQPASPTVQDISQTAYQAADGNKKAISDFAAMADPDRKIVDAGKRLGISDELQADHVTKSDPLRQVLGILKSDPTSQFALQEKVKLANIANRASDLIDQIGGTTDLSSLDQNIKTQMQKTHQGLLQAEDSLWSKAKDAVPQDTPAPATQTLDFLQSQAEKMQAPNGQSALSPLEKKFISLLTPADGKQPTYGLVDSLRREAGRGMNLNSAFSDADTGLSKKLYGLLSDDLENSAISISPEAASAAAAAKSATAARKGVEENMAALFGDRLEKSMIPELSGAMQSVSKGDTSRFLRILNVTPDSMKQEMVASGLGSAFRTAATRGDINFTTFSKWFDGLIRNKQAYAAVMSNLPKESRQQIGALYRISKGISESMQARIKTGLRSSVMENLKAPDDLASRLYSLAGKAGKAIALEAGTSSIGMHGAGIVSSLTSALVKNKTPAIKAVDAMLVSPEFEQLARAGTAPQQKAAAIKLAYSKPFTRFVRATGQPRELSNRERWVLQAMQANNQQR